MAGCDSGGSGGGIVRDTIVTLMAIFSFWAWARSGFRFPKYVHWIAVFSAIIGAFIALLGYASDAEHAHRALWAVIILPILTYFLFVFLGGGFIMANREEGKQKRRQ
jgi:predicted permease